MKVNVELRPRSGKHTIKTGEIRKSYFAGDRFVIDKAVADAFPYKIRILNTAKAPAIKTAKAKK